MSKCYCCGSDKAVPWLVARTVYNLCLLCWLTHIKGNEQAVVEARRQLGKEG